MIRLWTALTLFVCSLGAQPSVSNTKTETIQAGANLEAAFRPLVAGATSPRWIAWSVPMTAGEHRMCHCDLEGGFDRESGSGPVKLEGSSELIVLFRASGGAVRKIRMASGDCSLEAGGVPFYWIAGAQPGQSLKILEGFATGQDGQLMDGAIAAIALHRDADADRVLGRLVAPGQPEKVREKAIFWLGAARGAAGYEALRSIVANDASDHVRDKAVFALSVSHDTRAVDTLIDIARNDRSTHVRGQALFWLAQKAGKKAQAAIASAVENDPETEVKKKAVFALSQLPSGEGVPQLIEVARTNRNPAVRKQAMFWLGQSHDPRALTFFEQVLK